MKNTHLLLGLIIMLGSICQSAYSDPRFTHIHYGVVDAVYPDELRFVINDESITYSSVSQILDEKGETLLKKTDSLLGKYVKYHYRPTQNSALFLIDLKVISDDEFKKYKEAWYGY